MDAAKPIDLRAASDRQVWELEYDGPDLTPGVPIVAVPTTTGRPGTQLRGHHPRGDRRKDYVGHPSLLPVTTILDSRLTVGLPAGRDGRDRRGRDDPFARIAAVGLPEPIRRGDGPRRSPDGRHLAAAGRSRRRQPRGALADADGLAPRRGRPGERHGRRACPCAGPLDRERGKVAHGTALAAVLPEVLRFYLGTRDRELALVGIALGVASGAETEVTEPARPSAPSTSCSATSTSVRHFVASASQTRRPSTSSRPTPSMTPRSATPRDFPPLPRPGGCWRLSPARSAPRVAYSTSRPSLNHPESSPPIR